MRQFDVYVNPSADARGFAPLLVILSSHLANFRGVMIAPLLTDLTWQADALDIAVEIDGSAFILSLLEMAVVSPNRLSRRLGSLLAYEDQIRRGL